MGKKHLRQALWEANPNCYDCGTLTEMRDDCADTMAVRFCIGEKTDHQSFVIICNRCRGIRCNEAPDETSRRQKTKGYKERSTALLPFAGGANRRKQRRIVLYKHDPHCHWCGIETVWPTGRRLCDNTATVDHLRSRFDPARSEPNPEKEERTVLACNRCNNTRARLEELSLGIEKIRERAGHGRG